MAKRCVPCLSPEVKAAIKEKIKDPAVNNLLATVPDCSSPEMINLCGSKPRTKSAYQVFVSDCMKGKKIKSFGEAPVAMKACALEWRERKNG